MKSDNETIPPDVMMDQAYADAFITSLFMSEHVTLDTKTFTTELVDMTVHTPNNALEYSVSVRRVPGIVQVDRFTVWSDCAELGLQRFPMAMIATSSESIVNLVISAARQQLLDKICASVKPQRCTAWFAGACPELDQDFAKAFRRAHSNSCIGDPTEVHRAAVLAGLAYPDDDEATPPPNTPPPTFPGINLRQIDEDIKNEGLFPWSQAESTCDDSLDTILLDVLTPECGKFMTEYLYEDIVYVCRSVRTHVFTPDGEHLAVLKQHSTENWVSVLAGTSRYAEEEDVFIGFFLEDIEAHQEDYKMFGQMMPHLNTIKEAFGGEYKAPTTIRTASKIRLIMLEGKPFLFARLPWDKVFPSKPAKRAFEKISDQLIEISAWSKRQAHTPEDKH